MGSGKTRRALQVFAIYKFAYDVNAPQRSSARPPEFCAYPPLPRSRCPRCRARRSTPSLPSCRPADCRRGKDARPPPPWPPRYRVRFPTPAVCLVGPGGMRPRVACRTRDTRPPSSLAPHHGRRRRCRRRCCCCSCRRFCGNDVVRVRTYPAAPERGGMHLQSRRRADSCVSGAMYS